MIFFPTLLSYILNVLNLSHFMLLTCWEGQIHLRKQCNCMRSLGSCWVRGDLTLGSGEAVRSRSLNTYHPNCSNLCATQDLVDRHSASYPKALGVAWDSAQDTMATCIDLPSEYVSTKRGIISDVARTFDILGWLSPTILVAKILYQQLWEEPLGWDDPVPDHFQSRYSTWRNQLPVLATIHLPRCYFEPEPTLSVELHGFSSGGSRGGS